METKKHNNRFWTKFVGYQIKHRLTVLLIMLLLTGISTFFIITKLKVKTDFFEIYPPKHEYIKLYKEFRAMFGSANVLTIVLERTDEKDIYNPETLKKVDDLTIGVLGIPGCNPLQVSSIAHPKVKQIVLDAFGIGIHPLMYS